MSQVTSHVLDTAKGKPAKDVEVQLFSVEGERTRNIATGITNKDGRIAELLPQEQILPRGLYKLIFDTRKYFESIGEPVFYPVVEIHFTIDDDSHYHIPLLLSPFGYSTYRGS